MCKIFLKLHSGDKAVSSTARVYFLVNRIQFTPIENWFSRYCAGQPVNQQSGRSNQVAKQYSGCCEDTTLQAVQPHVTSHKQVPSQHVAPFFRDKIGIVGGHSHECLLRITSGIKDLIEFGERRRDFGPTYGNAGGDNEKVNQAAQQRNFETSHDFLGQW